MPRAAPTALIVIGIVLAVGGIGVVLSRGHDVVGLGYGSILFGALFVILGVVRRER